MAAASCGTALAAYCLRRCHAAPARAAPAAPRRDLLRDPAFIAVVAAASLIQASHAVFYGFSAVAWQAAGLDGTVDRAHCGRSACWPRSCCSRFSGRLPAFCPADHADDDRRAGAALRWVGMALDPPVAALPWLQMLHALSLRRHASRCARFFARHAPPGQAATAQGYLAIALGAGDGGRDGNFRRALRELRKSRLCGDGASGGRWRRLRCHSARAARSCGRSEARLARCVALLAARHDAAELAAFQIDHLARQAAVLVDPAPHRGRIDIPQAPACPSGW